MENIRIPINNTAEFLIGDIWVNVNIQFKSQTPLMNNNSKMMQNQLNNRLSVLAGEVSHDIREMIAKKLETNPKQ